MPHRARPMTGLLVFMGVNLVLVSTISPVYDFVCFHPYWERRVRSSFQRSCFRSSRTVVYHNNAILWTSMVIRAFFS
ncbi:hypothetical protein C2845_PM18G14800 [Panicum miliaceum]|uniref:Uncharacterized protein n=1 Tax=Panicum miliaceum TaxID=4540 RepID=A0A3L6PJE4_PANMI|nr:hypothetical protein C2845_PM18G14800 [Panicum miliaceum]